MSNIVLSVQFSIGALTAGERADVAQRRLSDRGLDASIDALDAMMAPLAGAAGRRAPPMDLKERVMAAVAVSGEYEKFGKQLNSFESGKWLNILPGIGIKRLWANGPLMMRCAPDAVIPGHEHEGPEHLVVVSGDFVLEGRRFAFGDHLFSPAGTRHEAGYTKTGCVLLIYN